MFPRPIPVLLYHFVDGEGAKAGLSVSAKTLERQFEFLRRRFQPIAPGEMLAALRKEKPCPPRPVVVTFDDGDAAFAAKVYPLLERYRIPAAVFVIAGWISRPGYLSWADLQGMSPDLVTVGSHTVTHRYLPDLSPDEVREELAGSKKILEQGLGRPVEFVSYPVGGFNSDIRRMARDAGYEAAFTTNRGRNLWQKDLFALKRVKMTEDKRLLVLEAKCSGFYHLPDEFFPKDPGGKSPS